MSWWEWLYNTKTGRIIVGLLYVLVAVMCIMAAVYFAMRIIVGNPLLSPRSAWQRAASLTDLGRI